MRFIATLLGVIASLIMLGVSGSMNFLFMASLGKTEMESTVLGAASASADGLKALLPFFIWWGWQAKRRVLAIAGSIVWSFFVAFSLLSAVGFSATNRGAITDTREGLAATFETAKRDLDGAQERLRALPSHRPSTVVSEAIEGLKQDRRWTSTKGCTDATASASRSFCEDFFAARAELASAVEGKRLRARVDGLKREIQNLRSSGAGQDSDPQVSILSKIFGHGEDGVRLLLIIVVALLVETGSSLGLWLSTAHSEIGKRRRKQAETETPAETIKPEVLTPVRAAPRRTARRVKTAPVKDTVKHKEPLAIEGKKMGDVVEYVLQRMDVVSENHGVSVKAALKDYEAWCEAGNEVPCDADLFGEYFLAIADECNLSEKNGRVEGLRIKDLPVTRAA